MTLLRGLTQAIHIQPLVQCRTQLRPKPCHLPGQPGVGLWSQQALSLQCPLVMEPPKISSVIFHTYSSWPPTSLREIIRHAQGHMPEMELAFQPGPYSLMLTVLKICMPMLLCFLDLSLHNFVCFERYAQEYKWFKMQNAIYKHTFLL